MALLLNVTLKVRCLGSEQKNSGSAEDCHPRGSLNKATLVEAAMPVETLHCLGSSRKNPALLSVSDTLCKVICEIGGGIFAGVCPPIPGRSQALVLFNSPQTGATLGCFLPELSAELVRLKISQSNSAFEDAAQRQNAA